MRIIEAAEFREQCLVLLDELDADGLVVTKHGKPVARVLPYHRQDADLIGSLRHKVKGQGVLLHSRGEALSSIDALSAWVADTVTPWIGGVVNKHPLASGWGVLVFLYIVFVVAANAIFPMDVHAEYAKVLGEGSPGWDTRLVSDILPDFVEVHLDLPERFAALQQWADKQEQR